MGGPSLRQHPGSVTVRSRDLREKYNHTAKGLSGEEAVRRMGNNLEMWEAGICGPQEIVFRNFKRLESKGGYDKRIYMYIYI